METRTATVTPIKQDMAPAVAATAAGWRFAIVNADGQVIQSQDTTETSATFTLDPGSYTATAVRLDNSSAALGPQAVSDAFVLEAPVAVDVAGSVIVTVPVDVAGSVMTT